MESENQFTQLTMAIETSKNEIVKAVNEVVGKSGLPAPIIILILQNIIADTKIAEYENTIGSLVAKQADEAKPAPEEEPTS